MKVYVKQWRNYNPQTPQMKSMEPFAAEKKRNYCSTMLLLTSPGWGHSVFCREGVEFKVTLLTLNFYFFRQRGCVFIGVSSSFSLLGLQETTQPIFTKFGGKVAHAPAETVRFWW